MHREDLLDLIWDAGFRPVERNTRYEVVREYDGPPSAGRAARRAAAGLGVTAPGSDEPIRGPVREPSDQPSQPPGPPPPEPSFGRSMGTLWMYTILRFLVFGVLFGLLWLVGVPVFLAAVLALVLVRAAVLRSARQASGRARRDGRGAAQRPPRP